MDSKSKTTLGINSDIVKQISKDKKEPAWMLKKRLEALKIFNKMEMPKFGPNLSELD